jgi:hypothetical protein
MFQRLDIFKTDSDGGVLWRGAAEDLVSAKRCIEKLALSSPGEYLVLDQHAGNRVHVTMAADAPETRSVSNENRPMGNNSSWNRPL